MKETELRKAIRNELDNLSVPQHLKGYEYLIEAVIYLIKNKKNADMCEIYYHIADICKDDYTRVERAMRHAKSCAKDEVISKYVNSRFISYLYYKIVDLINDTRELKDISNIEYDLEGKITFDSNMGIKEIEAKEAIQIAYALFDWVGMSYKDLDKIQEKIENK